MRYKLILDTETTGVRRHTDGMYQLSMVLTDENFQVVDTYDCKFCTELVTVESLAFLGLTMEDYKRDYTADLKDEIPRILSFLEKTNYQFYGYNYSFDRDILKANMMRAGYPIPMLNGIEVMQKRKKLEVAMEESGYDDDQVMAYVRYYFPKATGYHDSSYDTVCTLLLARDRNI